MGTAWRIRPAESNRRQGRSRKAESRRSMANPQLGSGSEGNHTQLIEPCPVVVQQQQIQDLRSEFAEQEIKIREEIISLREVAVELSGTDIKIVEQILVVRQAIGLMDEWPIDEPVLSPKDLAYGPLSVTREDLPKYVTRK